MDNGKPYSDALNADVALTIKCYRYYAGWADKLHGKTIPLGKYTMMHLVMLRGLSCCHFCDQSLVTF